MLFNSENRITACFLIFSALLTGHFAGCSEVNEPEISYDAMKIDQHMDAEVTFDETYRPQYHYTPKINWTEQTPVRTPFMRILKGGLMRPQN
ncbi:MAG: hypothetical protein GVY02_04595 [Bacteroidetes bacterium]|jgi:hypothetical protein|nr:hypothetical protein [Bacteroidota bacterium]